MRSSFKPFVVLAALITLLLAGTTPLVLAQGNVLSEPAKTFTVTQGWYEGRKTFYYDFGTNTSLTADGMVETAPIYVLITGLDAQGNPQMVEGQHNIVDVIPGDAGYSDLWEVTLVTVPPGYAANTITSAEELMAAGYEMTTPGMLVNCPIVPEGSTLSDGGAPLVQGWYKGQEVFYFDFGANVADDAPIYAFATGMDAGGNPQFVQGQGNVIGVIPGDEGYSAFWNVNLVTVPAGYEANTITSVEQVMAAGHPAAQPGLLVNCPVIRTEEAMSGDSMTDATMSDGSMTSDTMGAASGSPPSMLPVTGAGQPRPWPWFLLAGAALLAVGLLFAARAVRGPTP